MKIRSKNNLYPHRHFTEQLVGAFEKTPRESDLNYKTLSFLIWQLKSRTGASPATIPHTIEKMKSINNRNCWQGSYGKNEAAGNTGPERCAHAGFWNRHQSIVGKLLHGLQTPN
jgi:hypothetical protein